MGRGSSKAGGGGGGGSPQLANTPSGVTYQQFMSMSDDEKYDFINRIIMDPNLQMPAYLDNSETSKVLYSLGMANKPTVVSDAQLDGMPGRELFRTVYEYPNMPPPSSDAILDQIRNGDFTQLSGKGGSAHGRALYFATNFGDSATYGRGEKNPQIMRAKINPNANIRSEQSLKTQMRNDTTWRKSNAYGNANGSDEIALYALSHGIDGWYSGSYTMIVNRGILTASSQNKSIKSGRSYASDWASANNK